MYPRSPTLTYENGPELGPESTPLTVVVLSDYGNAIGGAEKVAIDSAVGLARTGVSVHFVAGMGPCDPQLERAGVQVHCANVSDLRNKAKSDLLLSGLWSQKCASLVAKLLRSLPAGRTVVHIHGWQRALTTATLRACRDGGHPVIMTLHEYGTACPNQGFFDYQRTEICTRRALGAACLLTHCDTRTYAHKLWRAGRTALQRLAADVPGELDDVIYLSELSREVLTPYFSDKTRWHSLRNPIPTLLEPRVPAERNKAFMFVGRVTREKGAELFAAAAELAGVPATFAGDGPALEDLKLAHPSLDYLGWLDSEKLRGVLQSARALVFPSFWYEAQPLVVQEALARGIPLIIADGTAARELVREGETGYLFRHMDATDLANKLRLMASDDGLIARMSERAYQTYWTDPPTLDHHVGALKALYATCLTNHRGARHAS